MKKILISCVALLFASSMFFGVTSAQYTLPGNRQTVTERAYKTWLSRIELSQQPASLTTLKSRVSLARSKTNQDWAIDLLTYIELLATQTTVNIQKPETVSPTQKTVSNTSKKHYPNYDTLIKHYQEGFRVYEGGDKGALISRYQFIAQSESFLIEDITISANGSIDNTIALLTLIDENGVIVGSGNPTGSSMTIRGIDYLLEQGDTNFYLVADFHTMGYGLPGSDTTTLNLGITISKAQGYYSGDKFSTRTENGDTVIVTPLKIREYGFVESFGGYVTDSILTENTENTLGLLTFTTGENDNRQLTSPTNVEVSLDQIVVTVSTNLTGIVKQQLLESLMLERIDSNYGTINGTVSGESVIFTPSAQSSSFARIEQGEKAGYRIVGMPPTSPGQTSIKVSIENLSGGGVTYSEGSSSNQVNVLDGGAYTISAKRVYEN